MNVKPLLLLILLLAGCTHETTSGTTSVIRFAVWVPLLVLAVVIGGIIIGGVIAVKNRIWGWLVIIVACLVIAVIVPGLFQDHATIADDHFTLRHGYWWAPTLHHITFADLKSLEYIAIERRKARSGTTIDYSLLCRDKNGTEHSVPCGDLMQNGGTARVLQKARDRGVTVIDRVSH